MQIQVSEHAIDKYRRLVKEKYGIVIQSRSSAKLSIIGLFEQSEKEELHGGLIKRIIDNNFEDSEYYRYENWRIVVHNKIIVTIEEAYLKRRNGLDSQIIYKSKRYQKYQNKLRKRKENYEHRMARKKASSSKCSS